MNLTLRPFQADAAGSVVSWVADERDLLWLAPATTWPLTERKVRQWTTRHKRAYQLQVGQDAAPVGYAEINPMRHKAHHVWLGHVVVDPRRRGQGLGRRFVAMLVQQAFIGHGASDVSLVVFPNNARAIACYHRNGFESVRDEFYTFRRCGPKHRMVRMDLSREAWLVHQRAAGAPESTLPPGTCNATAAQSVVRMGAHSRVP